jgi:1-pyrroline-5-carboxylate dehydrogenase
MCSCVPPPSPPPPHASPSSSRVAERLARDLHGRIKIEDAGFDWKILGPDVQNADYVAWQCDQDAYACSGQKCSAQSMLFAHSHWVKAGLFEKMQALAAKRNLADLTCGPVMTWTTEGMLVRGGAVYCTPGFRARRKAPPPHTPLIHMHTLALA